MSQPVHPNAAVDDLQLIRVKETIAYALGREFGEPSMSEQDPTGAFFMGIEVDGTPISIQVNVTP